MGSQVPPASPGTVWSQQGAHLAPEGRLVESWSSAGMVFPQGLLAETGLGRSTLTLTSCQGSGCCRQRKGCAKKPHRPVFTTTTTSQFGDTSHRQLHHLVPTWGS